MRRYHLSNRYIATRTMIYNKNLLLLFFILVLLSGCATEQTSIEGVESQSKKVQQLNILPDYPKYQGYPHRIMVFPWNISKVDLEKYPHFRNLQIGFGISNRLLDELFATGKFELIEEKQAILSRMLQQMQQCTSGVCGSDYAPMSRLPKPKYIVYPEVYHVGVEKNVSILGVNAQAKLQTEIGVQINFVDTQTGITKALGSYIGKYPNLLRSSILSNPKIEFSQSALGKAAQEAIKGALLKAIRNLPVLHEAPPPMDSNLQPTIIAKVVEVKKTKPELKQKLEQQVKLKLKQELNPREELVLNTNRTSQVVANKVKFKVSGNSIGITYHALIIGNNDYKYVDKLVTAVNDAQAVAKILKQQYGYKIHLLLNATRQQIIAKLDELRKKLSKNDNLLIYYAGHGYLDEEADRGYWLPVNATTENTAEWISTTDVTDKIKALHANHIMLVADSCYSGTLTRGLVIKVRAREILSEYYQRMLNKRSRTVMTSGGLEPVADGGRNNHSVFAGAFLDSLIENKKVIDGTSFFNEVRRKVILDARQTPEYSDIRFAGHKGGDFLFIRK